MATALLALGACTVDGGASPTPVAPSPGPTSAAATPRPTAQPTPSPAVSTAPAGEYGGQLVAIARADFAHRDVHRDVSAALAARGPGLAYSRMLRLRTGPEVSQPSLLLECDLCESWQLDGPLTYIFRLREGVRWHDRPPVEGRLLTAEDVVFSYRRQRTEGWPNAPLLLAMDAVESVDNRTVRVTLRYWDADFLAALADGHSKIVSPEASVAAGGLESGAVVGTGPWLWVSSVTGDGTVLEANPDYFEDGLPFLDGLTFKVIKDPDTRAAAFLTRLVDVYDVDPDEWAFLQSRNGTHRTVVSKEAGLGVALAMNTDREPFNDLSTRRAVFGALRPWEYLAEAWGDEGFVSAGAPVVDARWLLNRPAMEGYFGGAGPGRGDVELVVADFGDRHLALGRAVEEDLRRAGFEPSVVALNPSDYSERVWQRRDYQLFLGPAPPASGPNGYLFSVLHGAGQWNILGHDDPELDRLIEAQQRAGWDTAERGEGLLAIQRRLLDQAYMVTLGGNATRWALQDPVANFHPNTALSEYHFWSNTHRATAPALGG